MDVEETIHRLLNNASYLDQETEKWLHQTHKFTSTDTKQNNGNL